MLKEVTKQGFSSITVLFKHVLALHCEQLCSRVNFAEGAIVGCLLWSCNYRQDDDSEGITKIFLETHSGLFMQSFIH